MSATDPAVHSHVQDGILTLTLHNPSKRNAIFPGLYEQLTSALEDARHNPAIGAVIITGAQGYFCAGGDLTNLQERRQLPPEKNRRFLEDLHDLIRLFRAYPKPLIAAVEGGAAGAGVSIAFACDLLVVDEAAKFSVAYVKVGLTPDGGVTRTLGTQLPKALLMELCLTGILIDAKRLYQLGAVNRVVPAEIVAATAHALATTLRQGPGQAMARIKQLCEHTYHASLEEQLDREAASMVQALGSAEGAEGIAAFLEKRPTNFTATQSPEDRHE